MAQVDIDGAAIGRRTKVKYPVIGDVAATIDNILPHVKEKTNREFLDKMLKLHEKKLRQVIEAYTHDIEHHTPIHPEYAARIIDESAAPDAIFTADTGMCNVWSARYVTNDTGKRQLLGSFRHGTMANSLPQAIGAQKACPDRQVVALCGDGGLSMLLGELLTVKLHELPIKIFVFNNSSLGMVKLEMLVEGIPESETDHEHVSYAALAQAAGIKAIEIRDPKHLRHGISDAFAYDGPVLVDMVTDPNALSIPPDITFTQIQGFTKAAARTVLEGGVGKMYDLAKSNLRNIPKL